MQLDVIYSNPLFLLAFLIWSLVWKGYALWTAAKKNQLTWFILILLVNTLGLLEILYVLFLQKYDLGSKNLLLWIESNPLLKKIQKKVKR